MICPPSPSNISQAAAIIRQGGLVAFPTETVYGLGADATSQQAVQQIFKVKRRPALNPLIVHLSNCQQLPEVADIERQPKTALRVEKLKIFWPGPLSLILPKRPCIAEAVTAGLDSVAVRIPNHPVALSFLAACKLPVAAPSANLSSAVSPTSAKHVEEVFGSLVHMILDGGACQIGLESTVLSLLDDKPQILRPGAVTKEQLNMALGEEVVLRAQAKGLQAGVYLSPGQALRHYAPKTKLAFLSDAPRQTLPARTGLISFSAVSAAGVQLDLAKVCVLSTNGDLNEVAAKLFAAIHELDKAGLDLILIDSCAEEGLGQAIMDRLRRACCTNSEL